MTIILSAAARTISWTPALIGYFTIFEIAVENLNCRSAESEMWS